MSDGTLIFSDKVSRDREYLATELREEFMVA